MKIHTYGDMKPSRLIYSVRPFLRNPIFQSFYTINKGAKVTRSTSASALPLFQPCLEILGPELLSKWVHSAPKVALHAVLFSACVSYQFQLLYLLKIYSSLLRHIHSILYTSLLQELMASLKSKFKQLQRP